MVTALKSEEKTGIRVDSLLSSGGTGRGGRGYYVGVTVVIVVVAVSKNGIFAGNLVWGTVGVSHLFIVVRPCDVMNVYVRTGNRIRVQRKEGRHKLHIHVRLESNHRVWVVGVMQMIRLVMCTDMRVGDDYQLNLALRPATIDPLVSALLPATCARCDDGESELAPIIYTPHRYTN
ncbi:uncharacterized protein BO96DRAFT_323826 [Aspergillus niger CBS 101883]|uniref:Uncharacterized protein n=2 Tax=Aspergillus niger TaxID=5061 RepID=A2QE93_ASPNC|nr:uncharacterized protein BO96DRAFT_323826 [Aspergillus niger CBS 101883]XP_059600076.1 hypothetical protein An02g09860 [Aspergillus niger]PYH61710.1 hypothetical protein BO96DRAFT_323826 [Aspergillus niger CBS 101883]CAK37854.1 hypothetical protein An02g09860 [Aspergillus niger]